MKSSHNPKEYNGYKAYWSDGAQVLAPHDTGIIEEVNKVTIDQVKFEANWDNSLQELFHFTDTLKSFCPHAGI